MRIYIYTALSNAHTYIYHSLHISQTNSMPIPAMDIPMTPLPLLFPSPFPPFIGDMPMPPMLAMPPLPFPAVG